MLSPLPLRALAIAALVSLALTACGDDDASRETTAGSGAPDVEFSTGELPESMPSDFPIPTEASIGTGMVDRTAGRVEIVLRVPASVSAVVEFFEANLDARDYVVTSSEAESTDGWVVAFEKDGATGSIGLRPAGDQLTQAVVRLEQ